MPVYLISEFFYAVQLSGPYERGTNCNPIKRSIIDRIARQYPRVQYNNKELKLKRYSESYWRDRHISSYFEKLFYELRTFHYLDQEMPSFLKQVEVKSFEGVGLLAYFEPSYQSSSDRYYDERGGVARSFRDRLMANSTQIPAWNAALAQVGKQIKVEFHPEQVGYRFEVEGWEENMYPVFYYGVKLKSDDQLEQEACEEEERREGRKDMGAWDERALVEGLNQKMEDLYERYDTNWQVGEVAVSLEAFSFYDVSQYALVIKDTFHTSSHEGFNLLGIDCAEWDQALQAFCTHFGLPWRPPQFFLLAGY